MNKSPLSILDRVATAQYMGVYAMQLPRRGVNMRIESVATLPRVSIWVRWAYFAWSENK